MTHCFDPLLRKYVEDTRDIYPGRPDGDLEYLMADLGQALSGFLTSRCSVGGDLYRCLTHPVADHKRYFPDNGRPADPTTTSGDPARDVYRLGLTIHDEDDGGDIKWKLVHFVRKDPWLFAEWMAFVQAELDELESKDRLDDASTAVDQATDNFIFRATHLNGKTPIELFIERQPCLSDLQKQRLLRWDREAFYGTFLVTKVESALIYATDLANDRNYRLEATKPEALQSLRPGDLLLSRVTPWEDHWLLSGMQQRFENAGQDKDMIAELKRELRYKPSYRHADNNAPQIEKAFQIQQEQYQAWMTLFGQEELLFADGLRLGAAINRFHRYWRDEMVLPASGLTRAQLYRQDHGHAPPEVKFPLPDHLLKAKDTAAVFDPQHGLAFYVGYALFRSAFSDQEPLTREQGQRVWDYLIDDSTDYWLFQRMRRQYPGRTEYVFRRVLQDEQFQLDRDFDAILRKFKGEAMRRPVRPMITVVDSEEIKGRRRILK